MEDYTPVGRQDRSGALSLHRPSGSSGTAEAAVPTFSTGRTPLRRERLLAHLHTLVHRRLTLVMAPAGYGKTTLLQSFVAECAVAQLPLRVCWYTATPWEADGKLVLAGLIDALRTQYARVGQRALTLLSEAQAASTSVEPKQLVASAARMLGAELREQVADYTLLVIDDYQHVDVEPLARLALEVFLEHVPEHIHVVLLSRQLPGLNTSRLAVADELSTVGPSDLAFTQEEVAAFLLQRFGSAVDPSIVEQVLNWTEGWIAGLVLALPTQDHSASPEEALLSRLRTAWRDHGDRLQQYLVTQLLLQQTLADQEVLLAAALPDICTADELDRVLDRNGSAAILARFEQLGLPLSREAKASSQADQYRLHAIVQQFLREHLLQTDRRRYDFLCRRWGDLAVERADYAEALACYLNGRVYNRAARVLEQIGEQWIDTGRRHFVENWFSQLPATMISKRPRLNLCAARLSLVQGHHMLALERAREARFSAQRARDAVTAARALLLEALSTVTSGRTDEGVRLCHEALEHRTVRRYKPLLAEAYRTLSMAETAGGLAEPALEHMERALELYEQTGQTWNVAVALNNMGAAREQLGHVEQALWCHTRALTLRRKLGDLSGTGRSLNNLGLLHLYRGACDEAEALFREALDLATETANLRSRAVVHLNLGDLRRVQQRPRDAFACFTAALEDANVCNDRRWRAYALVGMAAAHLSLKHRAEVDAMASRALTDSTREGLLELQGHARTTLAAAALEAGRRREARALLQAAQQAAHTTKNKTLELRVHLWCGQAAYQQRRWGEALNCVQVATAAAGKLGGPAMLAAEGPALVPLLRMAATRDPSNGLLVGALELLDREAASAVREELAPETAVPVALPKVQLRLLGGFGVKVGGRVINAAGMLRSRVRELLAYLAAHPDGCSRDEIGAALWPEAEPGQEITLTHTTLHRLRQSLFPELVVSDSTAGIDGIYRINPLVPFETDIGRFEGLLKRTASAQAAPVQRCALLAEAVGAYGGPFLPDCTAEWALGVRARLERRFITALAQSSDAAWAAGDFRACIEWCERLIELEMDDPALHLRVLQCYESLNEPLAGILHYQQHVRDLDEQGKHTAQALAAVLTQLQTMLGSRERTA